jgi:chemotaxis protein methyltransferase CheR
MNGPAPCLDDLELRLLVEGVAELTGADFRQYAPASLKRRVLACVEAEQLPSIAALLARALHEPLCMERLVRGITVHTTEMFRDPGFFLAFREKVVPLLRTYPSVRLWVAGCSTGEEAYSLAIVLAEEGLLDRARIYATDLSDAVLARARDGIFPLEPMRAGTANYLASGGTRGFSEYYTASHDHIIFNAALRGKLTFARHSLVTDRSFNEFHAILCRNVMIYFDRALQARVHTLLWESLVPRGILALGHAETIRFTPHAEHYETLDEKQRLYRRRPVDGS